METKKDQINQGLYRAAKDFGEIISEKVNYESYLRSIDNNYFTLRLSHKQGTLKFEDMFEYSNTIGELKLRIGMHLQDISAEERGTLIDKLSLLSQAVDDLAHYHYACKRREHNIKNETTTNKKL